MPHSIWKQSVMFGKYLNLKNWKSGSFNSTTQSRLLTTLEKKPFENIVGKGENACNKHFLLFFHNVFYPISNTNYYLNYI